MKTPFLDTNYLKGRNLLNLDFEMKDFASIGLQTGKKTFFFPRFLLLSYRSSGGWGGGALSFIFSLNTLLIANIKQNDIETEQYLPKSMD